MTACQLSLIAAEWGCEPAETRKSAAKPWEIDDGLWARIEPLLPAVPRNPGIRAVSGWILARCCGGSCSCSTRGFAGSSCHRNDHETYRYQVRRFEITPHIARRGIERGSGLGVYRWVVEGTIALLHWFRRLRTRWEIRDDIHNAFVTLGCAIICSRRLRNHSIC